MRRFALRDLAPRGLAPRGFPPGVAASLTLCLGLLLSAPVQADGRYGHGKSYGKGYGHYQSYGHGQQKYGYGHGGKYGYTYGNGYGGKYGYDGDTLLGALAIISGTRLIEAYLYRPRFPPAPPLPPVPVAPVVAVPVQPRACYQVMVPYAQPYGGVAYAPQIQCY